MCRVFFIVALIGLVVLAEPCSLQAQSRKAVRISGPSNVGRFTTSTSNFQGYSYGVGNLSNRQTANSSILSSSISRGMGANVSSQVGNVLGSGRQVGGTRFGGSRSVSRSVGTGTAGTAPIKLNPQSSRQYQNAPPLAQPGALPNTPRVPAATPVAPSDPNRLFDVSRSPLASGASSYQAVFSPPSPDVRKALDPDQPITSLAPDTPGAYTRMIISGEEAFRQGQYRQAASSFSLARDFSEGSPESLLSLFHTYFATANQSYSLPAFYLQETLKVFPELPLAEIKPADFYGSPTDFIADRVRLETFVNKHPGDAEALLVLAYITWQENRQANETRKLLKRALGLDPGPEMTEAIDIFQDALETLPQRSQPKTDRPDTSAPAASAGTDAHDASGGNTVRERNGTP